jgi:drug/metabolite transporter (DMT)-like permease
MTAMLRQHKVQLVLAFAALYILWGSTFLAIAVVVKHIPPIMMGAVRFLIAGVLMLIICALMGKRIRINGRDLWRLTIIGVLLLTGGNVVVGWSEKFLPSGLAALILAVTPIWIAIIEAWILKSDRLSRRGVLGLAFGTLGLAILLWPKLMATDAFGRQQLLAAMALLFAALSWTCGSLYSKRASLSIDPFSATGWQMLLAGIVNFGIAGAMGQITQGEWTRDAILGIGYLITGGSLLGFTAFIWLLEHVPTAKVATYSYINPMVAVFMGWLFLDERIDAYIAAGSAVIIVGVILVTMAKVHTPQSVKPDKPELAACEQGAD